MQVCAADGKSWGSCQGCKVQQDAALDGPVADAPKTDAPVADAPLKDAAAHDNKADASVIDGPPTDGLLAEAGQKDGGVDGSKPDAPLPDVATPDALQPDMPQHDSLLPDTQTPDASPYPPAKPQWTAMPLPATGTLYAVWGSGPTDVYVAGAGGTILHHDGRRPPTGDWWTAQTSGTTNDIYGVWGSGPKDVFAAGASGTMRHHDGTKWNTISLGTSRYLYALWGSSAYDIYTVGSSGYARYSDRRTSPLVWDYLKSGTSSSLRSLWGNSPTNVIMVGYNGTILRYDGSAFKAMAAGPSQHLMGVWGASASDVFAVGYTGTILRYDGTAWKMMISGTSSNLRGVWGSGPTDVWAVGDSGTILHFDGKAWVTHKAVTGAHLYGVWGSGPTDVFAVGYNTILHYGPCHCTVGGRCYGGGHRDHTGCKVCDPLKSATALSAYAGGCTISGSCYAQGEQDSVGCQGCDAKTSASAWTPLKDICKVGGGCYAKGFWGFSTCMRCDPAKSVSAFSLANQMCQISGLCYESGAKDPTACQQCDPKKSTTAWTMIANKCLISGKCYNSGDKDPTGCQVCDPTKSTTAWTMVANKCLISGTCYNTGLKDSTGCQICDPTKNAKAWTMITGKCLISGKCYSTGDKDTLGCQTCDPTKSATAWTMITGKCLISGWCYTSGDRDTTGCKMCDPTKNPKAWSTAPPPASCALPVRQVSFAQGTYLSGMTVGSVKTDGSGYKATTGFTKLELDEKTSQVGRVQEYVPYNRNTPQREQKWHESTPLYLPNNMGYVRWFRDNASTTKIGALHNRGNGTTAPLYTMSGFSTSQLSTRLAASDDGKYVVTTRDSGIVLMRTDGALFPNSKSYVEYNLSPKPYAISPFSMTIKNNHVYFMAYYVPPPQDKLWYAPLSGSGGLKSLPLPKVGGKAPAHVDPYLAFSESGKVLATTAGVDTTNEDVITIDLNTNTPRNISNSPGDYQARGSQWGRYTSSSQMAVSQSGTYVAYVKKASSSVFHLYVARTDGTGTPYHVTQAANFSSSQINPGSLMFLDDENLLFTCYGSSVWHGDIFRFHVPTSAVSNLSQYNDASKPFSLNSSQEHVVLGLWLAPNKKFLYNLAETKSGSTTLKDIKAVDLTTWLRKSITSGARIYEYADKWGACATKPLLFFSGVPVAGGKQEQLFMLDMNQGTAPEQLTAITSSPDGKASSSIDDITPNDDCSFVAFRSGGGDKKDIYTVKLSTPRKVSNLTYSASVKGNVYIHDYISFAQDNSQVVYLTGSSSSSFSLKVSPVEANCCKPQTIHTAAKYWQLYWTK